MVNYKILIIAASVVLISDVNAFFNKNNKPAKIGYSVSAIPEDNKRFLEREREMRQKLSHDLNLAQQILIEKCKTKEPLVEFNSVQECAPCLKSFIDWHKAFSMVDARDKAVLSEKDKKFMEMMFAISVYKFSQYPITDLLEELLKTGELTIEEYAEEVYKLGLPAKN